MYYDEDIDRQHEYDGQDDEFDYGYQDNDEWLWHEEENEAARQYMGRR